MKMNKKQINYNNVKVIKVNKELKNKWNKFINGKWQKERPTKPGEYCVGTTSGYQYEETVILFEHKGKLEQNRDWAYGSNFLWWSNPIPKLPNFKDNNNEKQRSIIAYYGQTNKRACI